MYIIYLLEIHGLENKQVSQTDQVTKYRMMEGRGSGDKHNIKTIMTFLSYSLTGNG